LFVIFKKWQKGEWTQGVNRLFGVLHGLDPPFAFFLVIARRLKADVAIHEPLNDLCMDCRPRLSPGSLAMTTLEGSKNWGNCKGFNS
jgi:hypothetical protein